MRSPRHRSPARALGLALAMTGMTGMTSMTSMTGMTGCASSSAPIAAKPARRNDAERPSPFTTAPDATVPDASGTPRDIASLMGPRGLVLVLYRGHW
ncbi:MAG: hypothetical protein H0T76_24380 [Nannocystis sp.]|nr:hypothetical protein [Nannocystis sp.]MBA3549627.1 hypothetical protein [Nannocystis sp.]